MIDYHKIVYDFLSTKIDHNIRLTQFHISSQDLLIVTILVEKENATLTSDIISLSTKFIITPWHNSLYRIVLDFKYSFELYNEFKKYASTTASELIPDLTSDSESLIKFRIKFYNLTNGLDKIFNIFISDHAIFDSCTRYDYTKNTQDALKNLNYLYKKYNGIFGINIIE